MINEIHIQNFRCFEDTWVSGFRNINLIGGLNNSGKTALLEALFLASFPNPNTLNKLNELRKETSRKKRWDSLFFNSKKDNSTIKIDTIDNHNQSISTEFRFLSEDEIIDNPRLQRINNEEISEVACLKIGDKSYFHLNSKEPLMREWLGNDPKKTDVLPFIAIGSNYKKEQLADLYELVKSLNRKEFFHQILNNFDNKIKEATIGSEEGFSTLKLVLTDGAERALGLFGDAVRKLVEIFLVLLSNNSKVLFIDEIENGIHFTKHKEFWEKLFQISVELDIQIFATTHSIEMIQAFAEAAKGEYEEKAMYFTTGRARIENIIQIVVDPITINELIYTITPAKAMSSFRGEPNKIWEKQK